MLHKKKFAGSAVAVIASPRHLPPPRGRTAPLRFTGACRTWKTSPFRRTARGRPDPPHRQRPNPPDLFCRRTQSGGQEPAHRQARRSAGSRGRTTINLMIVTSQTTHAVGPHRRAHEWYLLNVWDVPKQKMRAYPGHQDKAKENARIMNALDGEVMVRRMEGHTILFVPGIYLTDETLPALFRVDFATGRQRLIRQGSEQTQEWLVDEKGEIEAEEDYDQKQQRWRILERREDGCGRSPPDTSPSTFRRCWVLVRSPARCSYSPREKRRGLAPAVPEGRHVRPRPDRVRDSLGAPIEDRQTIA